MGFQEDEEIRKRALAQDQMGPPIPAPIAAPAPTPMQNVGSGISAGLAAGAGGDPLSGAASGAAEGAKVAGPLGGLVGGGLGLISGIFGGIGERKKKFKELANKRQAESEAQRSTAAATLSSGEQNALSNMMSSFSGALR